MEPIYELQLTSVEDVARAAGLISAFDIGRVSIPHKRKDREELCWARMLHEKLPNIRMNVHLSLRNLEPESLGIWIDTVRTVNPDELLVVSGNPRPKADIFSRWPELEGSGIPLTCSHTCDRPERLTDKLSLPGLQAICLQITDDESALRQTCSAIQAAKPDLEIRSCLLIPNPQMRARLKFRPWHGLRLSDQYLDDQLYAERQTGRLIALYEELGIRPFVEAIPFGESGLTAADLAIHNSPIADDVQLSGWQI